MQNGCSEENDQPNDMTEAEWQWSQRVADLDDQLEVARNNLRNVQLERDELRLALADARKRAFERAAEIAREFGAQCAPGGVWVAEQIAERIEAIKREK